MERWYWGEVVNGEVVFGGRWLTERWYSGVRLYLISSFRRYGWQWEPITPHSNWRRESLTYLITA